MKHPRIIPRRHWRQAGQMLVTFAIVAVVLIGIVGLALDAGNLYVSRSVLSRSLDAAALTGVRNLSLGQTTAESMARSAFVANYRGNGVENAPVTLNVNFTTDTSNNKNLSMSATSVLDTYFVRIFPGLRTVTMTCEAKATRAKLVMALVLDRSGSMSNNGGSTKMPPAVVSFINFFDDVNDKVAMTSFASHSRVDVTMRQPFKSAITTAVNAMPFAGGTFACGGLNMAYSEIQSAPVVAGENVFKTAVFFTDGMANEFQYTWLTNRTWNIGGYGNGGTYGVFNISNGTEVATYPSSISTNYNYIQSFMSITGTNYSLRNSQAGTSAELEAGWLLEARAALMRQNNITIYAIGFGSDSQIDKTLLKKICNDPSLTTYNPAQPAGLAVFASSSTDIDSLFRTIAANIMLRLTQ